MTVLLVALGAALGAPARWALDRSVSARHDSAFPWGTLVVNVVGCLALGALLAGAAMDQVGERGVALLGTGFLGGFTTFSTFSWETVRLVEDGALGLAAANVALSVALGIAAAALGWEVTRALLA